MSNAAAWLYPLRKVTVRPSVISGTTASRQGDFRRAKAGYTPRLAVTYSGCADLRRGQSAIRIVLNMRGHPMTYGTVRVSPVSEPESTAVRALGPFGSYCATRRPGEEQ